MTNKNVTLTFTQQELLEISNALFHMSNRVESFPQDWEEVNLEIMHDALKKVEEKISHNATNKKDLP